MKAFYTLIFVLMAGTAYGQNDLRTCSEFEIFVWGGNECLGTKTYGSREKFVGRFGKIFFISGSYFWPNGDKYEGEFQPYKAGDKKFAGSPGGVGVFATGRGDKIESKQFKTVLIGISEKFEGQITYINNDKYVGQLTSESIRTGDWREGTSGNNFVFTADGKGIFAHFNGDIYDGIFAKGVRDGDGKLLFVNGDIYQGLWKNNLLWGLGSIVRVDGESFEGEFVKGTLHGSGIWKKNGKKFYEGNFQKGLPDGFGKEFDKNENVVYEGQWVEGKRAAMVEKSFSPQAASAVKNAQVIQSIDLSSAKSKCEELGFKLETEGFGKCVLQLTK